MPLLLYLSTVQLTNRLRSTVGLKGWKILGPHLTIQNFWERYCDSHLEISKQKQKFVTCWSCAVNGWNKIQTPVCLAPKALTWTLLSWAAHFPNVYLEAPTCMLAQEASGSTSTWFLTFSGCPSNSQAATYNWGRIYPLGLFALSQNTSLKASTL